MDGKNNVADSASVTQLAPIFSLYQTLQHKGIVTMDESGVILR